MGLDYNPANCVISVGVTDYGRSLAWYRDVLGFELEYELEQYGWCELKTPFTFNIGLGQSETVKQGNITPTFGVRDIDGAIAHLQAHDVKVEDWHEIPGMVSTAAIAPEPEPTVSAWCYVLRPTRIELLTDPTAAEQEVVAAHFAHLQRLLRAGSLVLAGPSPDGADTFGIVVLESEEPEAR